jgi:hypothetical protein
MLIPSRQTTLIAALLASLAGCDGTIEQSLPGEREIAGDGDLDVPDAQPAGRQTAGSPPLQLYVAHGGNDSADGRSPAAPLATLMGAHAKLLSYLPTIDRDVEIRIAYDAGKAYHGQEVVWSHASPDYTISFMPSDYRPGLRLDDLKGRPLFDGQSVCENKAPEVQKNTGEFCKFFVIDGRSRPASQLRFYYLSIRHYTTTGIALHNAGEGRNMVYGCRFEKIGNLYFPKQRAGFTAIGISSSNHNVIRNNHFVDIRNKTVDNRFMHAVYMNVGSSHNTVAYNNVLRVSGDPMKVRHYSNHNVIEHNTIRYAGVAAFLDWPEGGRKECFSWENVFRANDVHCAYDGGASALIKLRAPPEPDNGNPLCVRLGERVRTSGNGLSCP